MNLYKFIDIACGRDDGGRPKSILEILKYNQLSESETNRKIKKLSVYVRPEVNISSHEYQGRHYIKVDIHFQSSGEPELLSLWNSLKDCNNGQEDGCSTSLIIMPVELFRGKSIFFELSNPVFSSLTAKGVNHMVDNITMVFTFENCFIHKDRGIEDRIMTESEMRVKDFDESYVIPIRGYQNGGSVRDKRKSSLSYRKGLYYL